MRSNKFLIAVLTFSSVLMGTEVFAQAPGMDSGVFKRGSAGPAPNRDSVPVPSALQLKSPTFAGSGCPAGSVAAVMSPDGREVSVLFDSYTVNVGRATGRVTGTATCRVNLPFNVPAGYQAQIVKVDYRGFNDLPAGGRSRVTARFGFEQWLGFADGRGMGPHLTRTMDFSGPLQEDFLLSSIVAGPKFSPCGQPFVLSAESAVQVVSNQQRDDASASIDSLDASSQPIKLGLRWQRCRGQGPGGDGGGTTAPPGPPRPPPKPGPSAECANANAQLAAANQGVINATLMLGQVTSICGGNMFCVVQVQNAYNQARTNLGQTQAQVARACGGH